MYFYQFIFMCLYIGVYLYYQLSDKVFPELLRTVNTWVMWGFLAWGGYWAGKVIIDCIWMSFKNQMTPENVRNGILLAVLNFLPTLLIALFMLKEGFAGK